jgi:hypothetical protein
MTDTMKQMTTEGHRKKILYKSKGTQIVARIQELINLGHEIVGLVKNMSEVLETEELQVLMRFISEQTKVDEETGEIIAKNNKEIKADSLQSAYDTDATYRKKGDKAGKGYAVNICETCNSENPIQLITHYDVKPNIADDVTFAAEGIPEIKENFDLKDLYLDGGYCGDEVRNSAKKNEVTLHYTDMTGKKADPDKLTAIDFEFNEDNCE